MFQRPFEFWESERTVNYIPPPTRQQQRDLAEYVDAHLHEVLQHPFLHPAEIERRKFQRVQELVALAYDRIPMYREKYDRAGISPRSINSWDDFALLPIIDKADLAASFPQLCVDLARFREEELFLTRSSGSTGQVVRLYVDSAAILKDTVQGLRQFALQSGLRYKQRDAAAMIYTCPWWFRSVGGDYRTYFVSSLLGDDAIGKILQGIRPGIISIYPSGLEGLAPHIAELGSAYLVVVHSEQSTPGQRTEWARKVNARVLDEYSSEEATRIALELPCGHYHICEDAVHLEIVDPATLKPRAAGRSGLAVVTNLLNEAMPVIRYVQGDYAAIRAKPESCQIGWSQLKSIEGRVNDSFVSRDGKVITSGVLVDITYRWMIGTGIVVDRFQMTQRSPDSVEMAIEAKEVDQRALPLAEEQLKSWLEMLFGHTVAVRLRVGMEPRRPGKKRRPIRREFRE